MYMYMYACQGGEGVEPTHTSTDGLQLYQCETELSEDKLTNKLIQVTPGVLN